MRRKIVTILIAACLVLATDLALRVSSGYRHSASINGDVVYTPDGLHLLAYHECGAKLVSLHVPGDIRVNSIMGECSSGLVLRVNDSGLQKYLIADSQADSAVTHLPASNYEIWSGGHFYSAVGYEDGVVINEVNLDGSKDAAYRINLHFRGDPGPVAMDVFGGSQAVLVVQDARRRNSSLIYCNLRSGGSQVIGDGYTPKFSHDGRRIAYCNGKLGLVRIYDLQNRDTSDLWVWRPRSILDLLHPFLGWRPYNNYGIQWSLDDKWVLCGMMYSHIQGKVHASRVSADSPDWTVLITGASFGKWCSIRSIPRSAPAEARLM